MRDAYQLKCVAAAVACIDAATAFSPLSVLPGPVMARQQERCTAAPLSLRSQAEHVSRRDSLRLAVFAAGSLMPLHPFAFAEDGQQEKKKSKKERDAEYEEDLSDMKKARYGRQPTRLDVERCVPKIAPISGVMKAVKDGLASGDLAAVSAAIGDQTVEATKANVNLGKEISDIQIAKSYFYQYASKFSKSKDKLSPLTKDMLASLDIFYPAMATVEKSAKAGDQAAAATAFGQAEEAINTIVNSVEAETREGRLNSIKVSLAVLVGKDTADGLNVYQENMKEMRRRAKEGGEGGAPTKKFL
jgi:hypothetical protein